VQLAAFARPPAAPSAALLEKFISNQARTVVSVTPVVVGGAADITTAVVTTPLSFDSEVDPATDSQQVNNAALSATTTAFDLGAILGPLINNPIVGPVVLFGAIAFGFLVVLPVEWFIQTSYDFVRSLFGLPPMLLPLPGTITATADANATTGPAALLSSPALAVTADHGAAVQRVVAEPETILKRVSGDVGDGVSRVLAAAGLPLPKPPEVTHDDLAAPQRKVARELATTRDRINAPIGAVQSVIGDGRTIVRSAHSDNGSDVVTAGPARKTPVRDGVKNASSDIKKVVTKVSDSIKQAPRGGKDDDSDGGGGEGGAR